MHNKYVHNIPNEVLYIFEPGVRQVYCGAIGYLGLHRNLDLNVAIRTAIIAGGQAHFAVGGGVVYDSREQDEYEETLHKGRTLFRLIEQDLGQCGASLVDYIKLRTKN